MGLEVRKFQRDDVLMLKDYEGVSYLRGVLKVEDLIRAEQMRYSYSVFSGDRILLCAGVNELWQDRGELWAMFDANCRKEFVELFNMIKRFIDVCSIRRLEASVDHGFEAGHRLVRALGMKLECETMEAYRHNGLNASLYARVKWAQPQ